MQIGEGGNHPPGTAWIEASGGQQFPNHTNAKHGDIWNDCVVFWGVDHGTSLDLGPNFDTVIQSLVNEAAKFITEKEVGKAVQKVSYSIQAEEFAEQVCLQIATDLVA